MQVSNQDYNHQGVMAVRIGGVGARIYVPQLYVYACMYVLHDVHTWHVYTLSRGSRVLKNTKYICTVHQYTP